MHILHTPIRSYCPALDPVHVIEQRAGLERTPFIDKLLVCWLGIASLVGRAALDDGWSPTPDPREAKAGLRDRQNRILQRREAPAIAAIGRDFDPNNFEPRKTGEHTLLGQPRQFAVTIAVRSCSISGLHKGGTH